MVDLPVLREPLVADDSKNESDQLTNRWRAANRAKGDDERMAIALIFLKLTTELNQTWTADWAWGIPMVLLTVFIHVCGLGLISQRVIEMCGPAAQRRHP